MLYRRNTKGQIPVFLPRLQNELALPNQEKLLANFTFIIANESEKWLFSGALFSLKSPYEKIVFCTAREPVFNLTLFSSDCKDPNPRPPKGG